MTNKFNHLWKHFQFSAREIPKKWKTSFKLFFDEMEGWKEFNRGSKISKGMNYGNRKSLLFQNSVKWCPRKLKRLLGKRNLTVLKCFETFFHNLASTICYVLSKIQLEKWILIQLEKKKNHFLCIGRLLNIFLVNQIQKNADLRTLKDNVGIKKI